VPRTETGESQAPFNDAHLIQIVRGALGRNGLTRGLPRINVSSCKFVVTLHGAVPNREVREGIEITVSKLPGVLEVVNKLDVKREEDVVVSPGRV
jgi:osmotically-inducible protein OsmY